jgi:hypothetical protein
MRGRKPVTRHPGCFNFTKCVGFMKYVGSRRIAERIAAASSNPKMLEAQSKVSWRVGDRR